MATSRHLGYSETENFTIRSAVKFCKDRLTGGSWANTRTMAVHSGLTFLYEGSERVFPVKEVPFGV